MTDTDGRASPESDIALVTVSYRGDLALAGELCRSVDVFLDRDVEHLLVVSRADAPLFSSLCTDRRRIVVVEDVLPSGYHRIPAPQSLHIGPYRKRIREMWKTPSGLCRGWIVQQIVKLSAPSYCTRGTIVFADSDIELVRPVDASVLVPQGRTRMYRVPGATSDSEDHARWHRVASELLGIGASGYTGADYIGNLITWRRDVLSALQDRLTEVAGKRWDTVIAEQRAFSEYILYGVFVEHVLGEPASRQEFSDVDLVHAGWFYDLTTADGLASFEGGMQEHHVGVAIQSTENLSLAERRRVIDAMRAGPHAG